MAGAFNPSRFALTKDTNCVRLAATTAGCTVAANAVSNAPAAARIWVADCSALKVAAVSQDTYGAAAARIAAADGPCQGPLVTPDTTDPNEVAADCSSSASASQARAAASIGPEPVPENIREEFTSGRSTKKSISTPRL